MQLDVLAIGTGFVLDGQKLLLLTSWFCQISSVLLETTMTDSGSGLAIQRAGMN